MGVSVQVAAVVQVGLRLSGDRQHEDLDLIGNWKEHRHKEDDKRKAAMERLTCERSAGSSLRPTLCTSSSFSALPTKSKRHLIVARHVHPHGENARCDVHARCPCHPRQLRVLDMIWHYILEIKREICISLFCQAEGR